MSFLDTDPDAGQGTTRRPRGREAERILAAEMLSELRAMRMVMTEQAAKVAGRMVNNTLGVRTATFPPGGSVALNYHVAAGSIRVTNLSATGAITVTSAGDLGYVPVEGQGMYVVPAGLRETIPVASRHITLYGTPGERVSYMVFAGATSPTT